MKKEAGEILYQGDDEKIKEYEDELQRIPTVGMLGAGFGMSHSNKELIEMQERMEKTGLKLRIIEILSKSDLIEGSRVVDNLILEAKKVYDYVTGN